MIRSDSVASDKREYLSVRLAQDVPNGATLALCFDPEGDLDGVETVADGLGRSFRVVTYREDDLVFRLRLRKLEEMGRSAREPLLIRATMPAFVPLNHRMNLSPIADVIAMVEGQPVDLRTDAMVTYYTEPVVWPENLQEHAQRISRALPAFVYGYKRMRAAIGRNRPLARHHIAAALLLAAHEELQYQDMDLPTASPTLVVARTLGLSAQYGFNDVDRQLLLEVLRATSYQARSPILDQWFALPTDEAARLVVLADFLHTFDVPNAVVSLSGKGMFSQPVKELETIIEEVVSCLKERPDDWTAVRDLVDATIDQAAAEDVASLLAFCQPPEAWLDLLDAETPSCMMLALVMGYLRHKLRSAEVPRLRIPMTLHAWVRDRLDAWDAPHFDATYGERAAALLRLVHRVARVQERLEVPVPDGGTLDDYLHFYAETDEHRLELLLALAHKDADALADEACLALLDHFLARLEAAVANRLDTLDHAVAHIIEANPAGYLEHPHSSTKFLRPRARRVRHPGQRLFVWLFDGMRWDTWVDVVRPVLEEGFRVEEQQPLFAPVPTYTMFARTSVFAGGYPNGGWRGIKGGGFTRNEGELAARNVGINTPKEYEEDLIFLTQTDTAEGKAKLRALQPRRFNCLVFNISDDNIHDEQGDLREVNDAIRMKVERDVLPEMKRLVHEYDVVLITSDHGFVQLLKHKELVVPVRNETYPEVRRRYATDREDLDGVVMPLSDKPRVGSTTCAVGRSWFNRQTARGVGSYTRYDHGGISLSEIVVPGVVLHRATALEEVNLDIIAPDRLEAVEDTLCRVEVRVLNRGTSLATVRFAIAHEAPKVVDISKGGEAAYAVDLAATLDLRYATITVEAKGPNGKFAPVQGGTRQIPITVTPRQDKVEFGSALDVFDDLDDDLG